MHCWHMNCIGLLVLLTARAGLAEADAGRFVTVSGTGTVTAPPDQVELSIAVTTEGDDLLEARRDSDDDLRAILELGQTHGVAPEDFRVTKLKISYGFNEERRRFYYRVDRDAEMTLKDIAKFDALLAAALKRGGFNITGIVFGTSKGAELESEARRHAVAAARARAAELAQLNGLELGAARAIRDDEFSQRPFVTSVMPVVGDRGLRPAASGLPPGGGIFSVPDGKSYPVSQPAALLTRLSQPGTDQGDGQPAGRTDMATGLGVIETTAGVTIEFELVKR